MRWSERLATPFAALLLLTVGCQPTVYLMPTPEAIGTGEVDPFALNAGDNLENRNYVAYATNRLPVGTRGDRQYLTLFDRKLRVGLARIRFGSEEDNWASLHAASTTSERDREIPLFLENATEMAVIPTDPPPSELSAKARAFFDELNAAISQSVDPDLTVYVHGANNNFYRASAQASQYRHFTGRNSVVLVYAWPSAESILRYAVDVNNARETVPVFATLVELLAEHSVARRIDILAYSAGAQVVSPALASLGEDLDSDERGALREQLRLGEIYYAAPDVDFRGFLEDMAAYIGLTSHVTLALNPDDSVLAFSARHHGVSRAGRPDDTELTAEETEWVLNATRNYPFDVLWINPETMPGMSRGSHDFWYSHPWVSTDVLVQLLFEARPPERGLDDYEGEAGGKSWIFPQNYPDRITPVISNLKTSAAQEDADANPTEQDP